MTIADSARLKREILLRSMFPSMPIAAHVRFTEVLEDVDAAPGELLFDVGDAPDRLYFLIEGRVAMEREGQAPWVFAPLAVVGVIDAVLERQRTRNCRALEPSRFLAVRIGEWFDMMEDNGQVARGAIRNFAAQLHRRWQKVAPRLERHSDPPPPAGPGPLETYDKILALRGAASLRSAGMQAIASLATVAVPVALKQGEVLFERGADDENLHFIARGSIELTGDAAHHPGQMAHFDWSSTADSDPERAAASRRELFSRFADTPTLVIGGHFGAGHIRREGDAFRFEAMA